MSDMQTYSEDEEEPFQSSGDDWEESNIKKKVTKRISTRLSKKPRISFAHIEAESSEDESKKEVKRRAVKPKGKPGRKPVVSESSNGSTPLSQKVQSISTTEFVSGSFVINRDDAENFTLTKPPNIWKIDGKALLQKFEPFLEDNVLKFRNTSVYTGWSANDNSNYMPIKKLSVFSNSVHNVVVSFDTEQFKETILVLSD